MKPETRSRRVKLFADGADRSSILELYKDPEIRGFTTNPTLMRKAGIADYERFARDILAEISDRPFSFEVFADEIDDMERQAMRIAGWGENVYTKIPVTNTRGESTGPLIKKLARRGLRLNITALLTVDQVRTVAACLDGTPSSYVSVFAGRIADTGIDPVPIMRDAVAVLESNPSLELIWASPREVLNVIQADCIGCHIITATPDILKKRSLLGKDLQAYSLETVCMFRHDGLAAGFTL